MKPRQVPRRVHQVSLGHGRTGRVSEIVDEVLAHQSAATTDARRRMAGAGRSCVELLARWEKYAACAARDAIPGITGVGGAIGCLARRLGDSAADMGARCCKVRLVPQVGAGSAA